MGRRRRDHRQICSDYLYLGPTRGCDRLVSESGRQRVRLQRYANLQYTARYWAIELSATSINNMSPVPTEDPMPSPTTEPALEPTDGPTLAPTNDPTPASTGPICDVGYTVKVDLLLACL